MNIGKTTITDVGLSITAGWFRKERRIPWGDIRQIKFENEKAIVVFQNNRKKYKAITLGHKKDEFQQLIDFWESILIEKIRAEKYLSGSYINEKDSGPMPFIIATTMLSFFLYEFVFSQFDKEYTAAPPDIKPVIVWLMYYLGVGFASYIVFILYSFIAMCLQKRRWACWKVEKEGLFLKGAYNRWNKVEFAPGDVITDTEIVIAGKQIPWHKFTYNQMLPYLLAITGMKAGISPDVSRGILKKEGLRLLVFWPFALTAIWYFPALFIPSLLLNILDLKLDLLIIFGGCIAGGISLLGLSFYLRKKSIMAFDGFNAKIDKYRRMLGW